ncbi:MAG: hypothetical protein PVI30_12760 [Myxococcales bacterium]|jgi:hypothetical protein
MRLSVTAALAVAVTVALPARPAQAGAWVPEPGDGYLKLWTKWLYGFGYHDGDDETIDYGSYDELFLSTYGEYGVLPGLALTWHLDLVRSAFLEDPRSGDRSGHATPGDPRLGARFELLRSGRFALAGELTGLAPLADSDPLQKFVYEDGTVAGALRLGAGVWEAGARLSAGLGLDGYYAQAGAGYLWRSDDYDDVIQFSLEGGLDITSKLASRLRVVGHLALESGDAPYSENPAGVGNGVSYVGFALEADYALRPGWYLGGTLEGGVIAIRRQTGGPVFTLYAAHAF